MTAIIILDDWLEKPDRLMIDLFNSDHINFTLMFSPYQSRCTGLSKRLHINTAGGVHWQYDYVTVYGCPSMICFNMTEAQIKALSKIDPEVQILFSEQES
jgi:hypothetical protein